MVDRECAVFWRMLWRLSWWSRVAQAVVTSRNALASIVVSRWSQFHHSYTDMHYQVMMTSKWWWSVMRGTLVYLLSIIDWQIRGVVQAGDDGCGEELGERNELRRDSQDDRYLRGWVRELWKRARSRRRVRKSRDRVGYTISREPIASEKVC